MIWVHVRHVLMLVYFFFQMKYWWCRSVSQSQSWRYNLFVSLVSESNKFYPRQPRLAVVLSQSIWLRNCQSRFGETESMLPIIFRNIEKLLQLFKLARIMFILSISLSKSLFNAIFLMHSAILCANLMHGSHFLLSEVFPFWNVLSSYWVAHLVISIRLRAFQAANDDRADSILSSSASSCVDFVEFLAFLSSLHRNRQIVAGQTTSQLLWLWKPPGLPHLSTLTRTSQQVPVLPVLVLICTSMTCMPVTVTRPLFFQFHGELRKILISLIEAAQRLLCLNPDAAKIFDGAQSGWSHCEATVSLET